MECVDVATFTFFTWQIRSCLLCKFISLVFKVFSNCRALLLQQVQRSEGKWIICKRGKEGVIACKDSVFGREIRQGATVFFGQLWITQSVARVASVSVGFGSKELQRENGASKRRGTGCIFHFWLSPHFPREQNAKNPVLYSQTPRKRLLRRLRNLPNVKL